MTLRIRSKIVRIPNEVCTSPSHGLRTKEPVRLRGFAFRCPDSRGVDFFRDEKQPEGEYQTAPKPSEERRSRGMEGRLHGAGI